MTLNINNCYFLFRFFYKNHIQRLKMNILCIKRTENFDKKIRISIYIQYFPNYNYIDPEDGSVLQPASINMKDNIL